MPLDDRVVTRLEPGELLVHADAPGLAERGATAVLDVATAVRTTRLAGALSSLPDDWDHGRASCLGDRIASTGGGGTTRPLLERAAKNAGRCVTSAVSGRTSALVTPDITGGTAEARAALTHGTRVIDPDTFVRPAGASAAPPGTPAPATVQVPAPVAARAPSRTPPEPGAPAPPGDARVPGAAVVRAWAGQHGIAVNARGRVPRALVERYLQERQETRI